MQRKRGYKYSLDRTSAKFICPKCRQKRFVRYVENETGEYINNTFGRCDRENNCGYHLSPTKSYYNYKNRYRGKYKIVNNQILTEVPDNECFDLIPSHYVTLSLNYKGKNNLIKYLRRIIPAKTADDLIHNFSIGTSLRKPDHTVFWQIDIRGNVRQAKIMLYNPITGKRAKNSQKYSSKIFFAGKQILKKEGHVDPVLKQCFFGEHQLARIRLSVPIGIVESEKTAILMTAIRPNLVWLATGGSNGCRWTEPDINHVLAGRKIILYPDLGCYSKWLEKSKSLTQMGYNVAVSDLLEKNASCTDKEEGYDLADYFIKPNLITGKVETRFYPLPEIDESCFNH